MVRTSFLPALLMCTALPAAAETLVVTSGADAGAGSLREALALAANDASSVIAIDVQGNIEISETLIYKGTAPLSIVASDQTVRSDRNITLLAIPNGADLSIVGLSFAGPGGFDANTRDVDAAGKGIFVDVPSAQTGTVKLVLERVRVSGVAGHGIHVSDCDLADACGGGGGGAGGGSEASISVVLRDVTVSDVGNGSFDTDGLRVDERGSGDIIANIWSSRFEGIGADGVELDEGQDGNVIVQTTNTVFEANGIYCHPDIFEPFVPSPDEAEFDQGVRALADIPAITDSPDDACIEREVDLHDDGSVEWVEYSIDVDDGFDVDEAGPGGIKATLVNVAIFANLDEGLDFDEEDAGDIRLNVVGGIYSQNTDDGIKMSEEGEGGIVASVVGTSAKDNGGKGMVFEEEDGGDVAVQAVDVVTIGNDDSDDTGLEVVQDDAGTGVLIIDGRKPADGFYAEGVEIR